MSAVLEATSATADERLRGTAGVTIVDFSAHWCPPCRALSPVLDQLAAETDGLTVLKVDVDAAPELAARYGVMSFPTLLFFVEAQPVHRLVGARGLGSLREELHRVRSVSAPES